MNPEVVDWVTTHFLPFESRLRLMLKRVCASAAEVDDVVQEVYYKVLQLDGVAHIQEPQAFLVRTAKNVVTDRMRRDAIVSIEAMANLEELHVEDGAPSPERIALAREDLRWLSSLIERLPDRCKAVFQARRVYGLSQHETVASLNIPESAVEYETMRGSRLLSEMIAAEGGFEEYGAAPARAARMVVKKHAND